MGGVETRKPALVRSAETQAFRNRRAKSLNPMPEFRKVCKRPARSRVRICVGSSCVDRF